MIQAREKRNRGLASFYIIPIPGNFAAGLEDHGVSRIKSFFSFLT